VSHIHAVCREQDAAVDDDLPTLRDQFAMAALAVIHRSMSADDAAAKAYAIADRMLAIRRRNYLALRPKSE
jgi:hypothetical protein